MPQQRSADGDGASPRLLLLVCAGLIAASVGVWLFAFFPLMGNDYKFWVPLIYEGRIAFWSFGTLAYDFSPLRCLGLPAFASPNSLLFSIAHGFSLLGSDLLALVAAIGVVFAFAFLGALRLFRHLGLSQRAALLLATGWCLQGWAAARVIAGHLPFLQMLLVPWLLFVVIAGRAGVVALLAAAFWLSHMLYSGAFYSFLIALVSVGISVLLLATRVGEQLGRPNLRDCLRNAAAIAGLTLAMTLPKLIGVTDFLALFPREARLAQVPFWKALLYAVGNVALPVPLPYGSLVGWPFGNWESYQFLFPTLFFALLFLAWQGRSERGTRAAAWLALLLLGSALLTSGLLAPVFASLPILESLHVNPRWNAMILLPLAVLACVMIVEADFLNGRDRIAFWVLLALFVVAPLQLLDRIDMRIGYLYHDGIQEERQRVDICYEPIFGYGLEHFPGNSRQVDWLGDPLRDPRCLLASHDCRPGQAFERAEEREQLEAFALPDENASALRAPALALYGLGLFSAVWVLFGLSRAAWRDAGARPRR
jgi:hypothetical protein